VAGAAVRVLVDVPDDVRAGIVPLHPANDGSRDQFLFEHLAETATPLGVAVLRYDRRPAEGDDDVPLAAQADDALAAVAELRGHVGDVPIGLWGWSQGAWAAPLAASRSSEVAFLVLLAATGVSPAEQMRYGTAKHLRLNGYDEDAVAEALEVRAAMEDVRRGGDLAAGQAVVDRYTGRPWFPLANVERTLDRSPWHDMDFDPAPVIAKVRCPTLLFYGEDDEWTPVEPSIEAWERNANATVVRLPGTTHAPTIDGAVSPEYTRVLTEWLTQRV
jgi:pimeloyl-ACP methyl ester carboxylesterase